MENLTNVINSFDYGYIFTVIALTFGIIYFVIPKATKLLKIVISLIIGVVLGFVYFKMIKTPLNILLPSFTASIVFYNWLIKPVLKFFNVDYETKQKTK